MRILREAHPRRGDTDPFQQFRRPLQTFGPRYVPVSFQNLRHLGADGEGGIQACHRLLKNHRHLIAAQPRHLPVGQAGEVVVVEPHDIGGSPGPAREQVHRRQRGDRFAAPGFADQAMGFPACHFQRDAAHGRRSIGEPNAEVLDFQHGRHRRCETPSRSRSPSPNKFMPNTSTNNAIPGTMMTQGLKNM